MVEDATSALKWLQLNLHPESRTIVWGHSLGTGVTAKLGSNLKSSTWRPTCYVLEAPFNCVSSIIAYWRENGAGLFGRTMGTLSSICHYFVDTSVLLKKRDLLLDSETWLLDIKEPIFILHAKDDAIFPFELAEKLYHEGIKHSVDIKLFSFEAELRCGHYSIYKSNTIDSILQQIINRTQSVDKTPRSQKQ